MVNLAVGAGIFGLPALAARELGAGAVLAYLVCAVLVGLVGLCLAEVGSRVSDAGGLYGYARASYGGFAGTVTGHLLWFANGAVGNAAVAVLLVDTLGVLVPWLAGPVARAAVLLGEAFELRAEVVSGDRRGRELGFPTANLVPPDGLARPGHGVYACLADGRPAAVNVGVRPTFGTGRAELIEAYLLDFEGDLYGQELRLRFIERLRGEQRFETAEALIEEMHRDVERTRAVCAGL